MSSTAATRCRFAPSPTGFLHVGSAQSALFNWLFARQSGAQFLLRIEDTDAERNRPELTENILDMLRWLEIDWDNEPVHQSDRFDLYKAATETLEERGQVYWCDCTREDIDARNASRGRKPGSGYDGFCRDRGLERAPGRALRLRTPDTGTTSFDDVVRGHVAFENTNIEDFVIVRSNGMPLFLLVNVIDDHDMEITHVIRGEDHLNNTPKQLLLSDALGYGERPTFAHLPLLVNAARKKLSKRRDDVSVADYKARGILPQAMRNYLALLGWAPRDGIEIRPIEEMIEQFRLEDVNPAPAYFDVTKLLHINAHYIRELPTEEFTRLAAEFLPPGEAPEAGARTAAGRWFRSVSARSTRCPACSTSCGWMSRRSTRTPGQSSQATRARAPCSKLPSRTSSARHGTRRGSKKRSGPPAPTPASSTTKAGCSWPRRRRASGSPCTGRRVGPPLWESIAALGRDRAVARLRSARARIPAEHA